MTIQNTPYPSQSIAEVRDYLGKEPARAYGTEQPEKGSFKAVLQKVQNEQHPLRFSRHATNRLQTRGIEMNEEMIERLQNAKAQAKEKGINESLILMDDMAFIVNVPNNTVVTAMGREENTGSIFTNIDGAVIA
ncbi:MAG: hypothetical protein IK016_03570 [Lachnospiraceae bacterium]|nr:hypothetical protein [Lachnospiraceae bacterium]